MTCTPLLSLLEDPEVVDLCLCSSDNSLTSSDLSLRSNDSKLMPKALLQQDSYASIDSDNSSSRTGGKAVLAHPRLIGTLVYFNKSDKKNVKKYPEQHAEQLDQELSSIPFFLGENCF